MLRLVNYWINSEEFWRPVHLFFTFLFYLVMLSISLFEIYPVLLCITFFEVVSTSLSCGNLTPCLRPVFLVTI